ncbi:hypothetical protein PSN45_004460 [Yamadazyma tenuis]|nr:hypothetical protein PSN45_004460 [Yamadazyma tenuis]
MWKKADSFPDNSVPLPPSTPTPTPKAFGEDASIIVTPNNTQLDFAPSLNKTPNVLLSEFFSQKGNKPLTPIEYQGVMSLLSQSQGKSNNGIISPKMPGSFTRYDSPSRLKLPEKSNKERSLIESTPSQQSVLKNTSNTRGLSPQTFATPEYKHKLHGTTESAISSVKRSAPSIKRVYQFSGLPSPYRTKIKAPVLSSNKKVHQFDTNHMDSLIEKSSRDVGKPLNKTASSLLSVLDNNKRNQNTYLHQFSNPYMGKSAIAKRQHNLTADVINSSIMFDQSTDLPDTVSNNSSITTPAAETASAANTNVNNLSINAAAQAIIPTDKASSTYSVSFPTSVSAHPQVSAIKNGNLFNNSSVSATTPSLSSGGNPNASNGSSDSSTKEPQILDAHESNTNTNSNSSSSGPSQAFDSTSLKYLGSLEQSPKKEYRQSSSSISANVILPDASVPPLNLSSSGLASNGGPFNFPQLELVAVELDSVKVSNYKYLFSFNE